MKYYAKYIPYIVFFAMLFLGVITIFMAYLLSNPVKVPIESSAQESEPVIDQPISLSEIDETDPFSTLPGNIDESIFAEFEPKPPVCLSFLSATQSKVNQDGKYPTEAVFDFSVATYDPNEEDKIEKIDFEFYAKETGKLADIIECYAESADGTEDAEVPMTETKCTGTSFKEDLDLEREVFQANVRNYAFPSSGDFRVGAIVYSSDGSKVDCRPSNGNGGDGLIKQEDE